MTQSLMKVGGLFLPDKASVHAASIDNLYYFIFGLSTVFFIGIMAVFAYFLIRFRRSEKNTVAESQIVHNTLLEIIWTVIPSILVFIIFVWGIKAYIGMSTPSSNALEIHVTAKKWAWTFEYPKTGITSSGKLVVPLNQPITLIMISDDVIHSFFAPNMRVKKDVIPNRYTVITFTPNKAGSFQIFCTEYCGDKHSEMLADLVVMPQDHYKAWEKEQTALSSADLPLPELGRKIMTEQGCLTCHSIDGSKNIGPTFKGLFMAKVECQKGIISIADESYLKESIEHPSTKIVKGFSPIMPEFKKLSNRELNGLVEYIKTL